MYDIRTRLSQTILNELRKNFKKELFTTVIPVSTKLAEAPGYGLPALLYDPRCSGTIAYKRLAMEVIADEEG
jgi:chromosome partitioning protein